MGLIIGSTRHKRFPLSLFVKLSVFYCSIFSCSAILWNHWRWHGCIFLVVFSFQIEAETDMQLQVTAEGKGFALIQVSVGRPHDNSHASELTQYLSHHCEHLIWFWCFFYGPCCRGPLLGLFWPWDTDLMHLRAPHWWEITHSDSKLASQAAVLAAGVLP